jgi:hypothetical protein
MRWIVLGASLWLLATGLAWSAEAPVALRFLDDRGEKIESALEVCFQTGLRVECKNLGPGESPAPPAQFLSLRVEGPDHGPVSLRYEDLEARADGQLLARVPRKALLQIDKLPTEPLTVSVYDRQAPSFDKPLLKVAGVGTEGIKIPTGEVLVVLSSGGQAPDLHPLSVAPGALSRVEYTARKGWSLVVRCRGSKTSQPLKSAVVSLESVPGYGRPNHPAGETSTGADGLALFQGLANRTTVSAKVHHPELLPQQVQGLYAAPGALSFRDVVLEEGGTVRGRVTVNGKRQEGILCKVADLRPPVSPDQHSWKPEALYEGTTDRDGICRSSKLPAGSYVLFVTLPESKGRLDREIVMTNGSDFEEEFAFSEIRVSGKVTRGEKPAPGLTIRVFEKREEQGMFMVMAEGKSGEDGRYELSLWKSGQYDFALFTRPKATPVAQQTVVLEKDQEPEAVDFSLESMAIRGKVVDKEGRLLEEAWVTLRWNVLERSASTDERGEFEFLLDSEGKGDIRAQKKGYREAPLQEMSLESEAELPPITLVLVREKPFKGKILSAAGSPVAGAWVEAVRSVYGDEFIQGNSERTDAEGRFELPPVAEGRNRLFVSGPGCPLSIFEPSNESGDLSLRCQGQPSVLDLTVKDSEGHAVANARVILRRGAVIIPTHILSSHLGQQGFRAETDLSGRLVMPNLAPGDYEIFLANPVTEGMIEAGSRTGYLSSARLSPLNPTVLQLTSGVRISSP